MAHPHITNPTLRANLENYMQAYLTRYFGNPAVRKIGWNTGQPRENMDYPPEVVAQMNAIGDVTGPANSQRAFYAAWKYAQAVPSQTSTIYNAVRPALIYPPTYSGQVINDDTLLRYPFVYNDYIAGYRGFINLYDMVQPGTDATLRANVEARLNILMINRTQQFAKEHPWLGSSDNPTGLMTNTYTRTFDLMRNFMYLTPELGQYMAQSSRASDINTAIDEYTYLGPYWFTVRNDNAFQENSAHHLFDSPALFSAKAYIQNEPRSELSKYIDVSAFAVGDLYYINNLATALAAQP